VTSGLRLGTPAVTTRGFTVADCEELAGIICDVLDRVGNAPVQAEAERAAGKAALALCRKHPVYAQL
jgi:glycine hydroxymethyltransferase